VRRWATLIILVVTMSAMSGCAALPAGVDGDLTDDWKPLPAATEFRAQAATCHAELVQVSTIENWSPVPCTETHVAETVAVVDQAQGTLDACTKTVNDFLGGDWRTGWVVLQPVLSKAKTWVRCDIAETSPIDGALVRRRTSMKGALRGPLRMSCANPKISGDSVTEMHPIACGTAHTAEFAGLFATTKAKSSDLSTDDLARGCDKAIARFTGLKIDDSLPTRVGWLGFPPDDTAWQLGDRAIRCFLWLNGEKMTGSYRNVGPTKLKIHYAKR
jgi:hypothetical protein